MIKSLYKISFPFAVKSMLYLLSTVIFFHFLIIINVIPYSIVWGGQLNSQQEMIQFEFISISINLVIMFVLLMKGNYIRKLLPSMLITFFLWVFIVLFVLNTFGNLMAESMFEKLIFTPLTFLFSILLLRIVLEKNTSEMLLK